MASRHSALPVISWAELAVVVGLVAVVVTWTSPGPQLRDGVPASHLLLLQVVALAAVVVAGVRLQCRGKPPKDITLGLLQFSLVLVVVLLAAAVFVAPWVLAISEASMTAAALGWIATPLTAIPFVISALRSREPTRRGVRALAPVVAITVASLIAGAVTWSRPVPVTPVAPADQWWRVMMPVERPG